MPASGQIRAQMSSSIRCRCQRYTGHLHIWQRISQLCLVTVSFLGHRRLGLKGCFPKDLFIQLLFCCFERQKCLSKHWPGDRGGKKDAFHISFKRKLSAGWRQMQLPLPHSVCLLQHLHKLSWGEILVSCALLSYRVLVGSKATGWTLWVLSGFDLMGSSQLH